MPTDKRLHLIVGAVAAAAAFFIAQHLGVDRQVAGFIALAVAVIGGGLKEARDATGRGDVEFMDFVATAAGGLPWLIVGVA